MSTTSQPPQKNPAAGVGKSLQRLFMKGHVSLYRLTGGKVGGECQVPNSLNTPVRENTEGEMHEIQQKAFFAFTMAQVFPTIWE